MRNSLKYKDFIATVQYSDEDEAFIGHIKVITSVVSFKGQSVNELKRAFEKSASANQCKSLYEGKSGELYE